MNFDASKRAEFFKNIHNRDRVNIEKMTKMYEKCANKGRKEVLFELGDLVWVHLRKDRFPERRKSPELMVHSKCFAKLMTMHMKLIFQILMV